MLSGLRHKEGCPLQQLVFFVYKVFAMQTPHHEGDKQNDHKCNHKLYRYRRKNRELYKLRLSPHIQIYHPEENRIKQFRQFFFRQQFFRRRAFFRWRCQRIVVTSCISSVHFAVMCFRSYQIFNE